MMAARRRTRKVVRAGHLRKPIQIEVDAFRKKLAKAPYENATPAAVRRFKNKLEELASRVRSANPNDMAWRFYDKDMARVSEFSRTAFNPLYAASTMVAGAAERIK